MPEVRLRPTTADDLEWVLAAERHEENRDFVGQWGVEQHVAALNDPDIRHLVVELPAGEAVGYTILRGLSGPHDSIVLQRLLITDKGRGYGRAALGAIKRLAFEELGAHRLWLDVMEHNHRARRLYESEGFVREGTLREAFRLGERYVSLHILSVLVSEYRPG